MRPPTGNIITQAQHLVSKSVDYSYYRNTGDATIYAPESGVIDSYQQRGSGTSDGGNCLRLKGATGLHQFAHCERSLVKVGQKVSKGQPLAIMGSTGYVQGRHLHYWVLTPSGYKYPPTLYTEPFGGTIEPNMAIIQDTPNWYGRCNDTHWRINGGELPRAAFLSFVNKEFLYFVETISALKSAATTQEWQNVGKVAVTDNWEGQIHNLNAELKKCQASGGGDIAGMVKENNAILKWLKSAWESVFKTKG